MSSRAVYALVAIFATASCDPGVRTNFMLTPPAPPGTVEQSVREGVVAIVSQLAGRYDMESISDLRSALAGYRTYVDSYGDGTPSETLSLYVYQDRYGFPWIQVSEFSTTRWSPMGDSIRRELRDTLNARFPSRIQER